MFKEIFIELPEAYIITIREDTREQLSLIYLTDDEYQSDSLFTRLNMWRTLFPDDEQNETLAILLLLLLLFSLSLSLLSHYSGEMGALSLNAMRSTRLCTRARAMRSSKWLHTGL